MTPKDRITIALSGGVPDRVPVTPGLSEMVPVRYFNGQLYRIPLEAEDSTMARPCGD